MDAPKHTAICHELTELYCRKNKDYGDSYHETYRDESWAAFRIRLTDKLNRFKTLTKDAAEVKDESIRDTLLDLANYAILAVMELDHDAEIRDTLRAMDKADFETDADLSGQECLIAQLLGADYVTRDEGDLQCAQIGFWVGERAPKVFDCGKGIVSFISPQEYGDDGKFHIVTREVARIDAEMVKTHLAPGDCVYTGQGDGE